MRIPVWGWALLAGSLFLIMTVVAIETRPQPQTVAAAAPTPTPTRSPQTVDERYIAWARTNWTIVAGISDETLIELATTACDTLDAGATRSGLNDTLRAVYPDRDDYFQATRLVDGAVERYCPENTYR